MSTLDPEPSCRAAGPDDPHEWHGDVCVACGVERDELADHHEGVAANAEHAVRQARGRRRYEGSRTATGTLVYVDDPATEAMTPLRHRPRHSPDGFEWGYGGSGPSDLALAIMWHHLGHEPTAEVYQAFKFAHVAGWGDTWSISGAEIDAWLDAEGQRR